MADKTDKKRILDGNFENDESYLAALEKSYEEARTKIGTQGNELGDLRKQSEQTTKTLQQYTEWAQQVTPYVNWINQNRDKVQAMMSGAYQQQVNPQPQNGQPNKNVLDSLLSDEEKKALYNEWANQYNQQYLGTAFSNFSKLVEQYAQQQVSDLQKNMTNQIRAQNELIWKGLEQMLPQEQIEKARNWQQEALKYADPSKIDPLQAASAALEAKARESQLQTELDTLRKEKEERDRNAIPSLTGSGASLFSKPKQDTTNTTPQNQDEQLAAALKAVESEHGDGAVRTLFPTFR